MRTISRIAFVLIEEESPSANEPPIFAVEQALRVSLLLAWPFVMIKQGGHFTLLQLLPLKANETAPPLKERVTQPVVAVAEP